MESIIYRGLVLEVQDTLKVIGPGLQDLTIELGDWTGMSTQFSIIQLFTLGHSFCLLVTFTPDLSTLSSLRSLHFRAQGGSTGFEWVGLMMTLQALLTLPSLSLALVYEIYPARPGCDRIDFAFMEHFYWNLVETRLLAFPQPPTSLRFVFLPNFSRIKTRFGRSFRKLMPGVCCRFSLEGTPRFLVEL